jgi:hypothetical protein
VRDTAPTPRRHRAAAVVAPPVPAEAKPLPWPEVKENCQAPVDVDDPTKGLCGKEFIPVGNQRTCPECSEKLEVIGFRRRGKAYYWKHREEILAADRSPPLPCKAPVDVDDLSKGLCGKPSRNRPRPYKTCTPECSEKLKVFNRRQAGKRFRQNHREELLALEKADRKANPEWYRNNWARFYAKHRKRLCREQREKRAARTAAERIAIAARRKRARRKRLTLLRGD